MKKFLFALLLVVAVLALGFIMGWYVFKNKAAEKSVDSQSILSALRERGFLVTETSVAAVATTIKNDQSSIWQRLLWGQEIKASGVAEVNLGVDLSKVKVEDISLADNKIIVKLPTAEIFNSRLVGNIEVENKQGVLKRLLENDDGYNQAMAELLKQAEAATFSDDMLAAADNKARQEIKRLVGYMAPNKIIEVYTEE